MTLSGANRTKRSVLPDLLDGVSEDEEIGTVTAAIHIRTASKNRFNALRTAEPDVLW